MMKQKATQTKIKVKAGDVFLLCSDGLNGMVNDKGLEMMLEGDKLELSGDNLIRAALDAGGTDNITATIVAIDESVYDKSTFVEFNPVKKFNAASTQSYAIPSQPTKGRKAGLFSTINIVLATTFVALLVGIGYFFFGGEPEKDPKKPTVETKDTKGTNLPTTVNNEGTTATIEGTPIKKAVDPKKDKKIKVVETKDTTRTHKVEKGQNLKKVLELCIKFCPTLTLDKIKKANMKLSEKIKAQITSETEAIEEGTTLTFPCD